MPLLCTARLGESIHRLLLVQAFRPDRLIAAMHLFVDEAMGSAFMKDTELVVGLPSIIENEVSQE
jgi:dynein heavy chain 1